MVVIAGTKSVAMQIVGNGFRRYLGGKTERHGNRCILEGDCEEQGRVQGDFWISDLSNWMDETTIH